MEISLKVQSIWELKNKLASYEARGLKMSFLSKPKFEKVKLIDSGFSDADVVEDTLFYYSDWDSWNDRGD